LDQEHRAGFSADLPGAVANAFDSKLTLSRDFPVGRYRVDFFMDDQLLQSSEFQVAQ